MVEHLLYATLGRRLIVEKGCKSFCFWRRSMCFCSLSLVNGTNVFVKLGLYGAPIHFHKDFRSLPWRLIVRRWAQNPTKVCCRREFCSKYAVTFVEEGCAWLLTNTNNAERLAGSLWSYSTWRSGSRQCAWLIVNQGVRWDAVSVWKRWLFNSHKVSTETFFFALVAV